MRPRVVRSHVLFGFAFGLLVASACAKPKKKDDAPATPAPAAPTAPAPAPTTGPSAQLPVPAPGPAGPALPALPLPFVAELGLSKLFSLEAPSSVQGLGVAPETPEDEGHGMMLTDSLRSRDACVARQLAGAPMADLRTLARRLCMIEAVGERVERGKRYASLGPLGFGAYVEEGSATIHLCLEGKPYSKLAVEAGTHGRVKGTLKLVAAPRALEGRFDNGVTEEGRTVYELAVADGAARQKARLSLASSGVSELYYSATAPTPLRLGARIDGVKGSALIRTYAADLASGQEAVAIFDASGTLVDAAVVTVGASSLLPIPAGASAPRFGDDAWDCEGESFDFSTTTQELTALEACDAAAATPFVPTENCEAAPFEPVPRQAFTCDTVTPEGC